MIRSEIASCLRFCAHRRCSFACPRYYTAKDGAECAQRLMEIAAEALSREPDMRAPDNYVGEEAVAQDPARTGRAERPNGRFVRVRDYTGDGFRVRCSECHAEYRLNDGGEPQEYDLNYCPRCGAKMDEADDE
jgi:hypothetical protein